MAINVNEEGVMKPLTIDGAQTSGFTINGIELLFNGTLPYAVNNTKYYDMEEFVVPRSPQDYKFFIIISTAKYPSGSSVSGYVDSISVIDLERFFDGAMQTATGSTTGYNHVYPVRADTNNVMFKDNPDHTKLYIGFSGTSATVQYYHKIFGVY